LRLRGLAVRRGRRRPGNRWSCRSHGGNRFTDYTKVGLPLTFLIFLVVLFVLPLVWPLQ